MSFLPYTGVSLSMNDINRLQGSASYALEQILEWREQIIEPMAKQLKLHLGPKSIIKAKPMVLLLGNHSSGKSSFINHLLGQEVQETGAAPTDDRFTILMNDEQIPGEVTNKIPGDMLVGRPDLPFGDLEGFGNKLVQHLTGKALNNELLEDMYLIDSPGMIDSSKQEVQRPYNFLEVTRYIANISDLILLFFDVDKPGSTAETLGILSKVLINQDQKLRILMNKADSLKNAHDYARAYGNLCWNLASALAIKDLPSIYTIFIPGQAYTDRLSGLDVERFKDQLSRLEHEIKNTPLYRRSNTITFFSIETERLYIWAILMRGFYKRISRSRFKIALTTGFIAALALFTLSLFVVQVGLPPAILAAIALPIGLFLGYLISCSKEVIRRCKMKHLKSLDDIFWKDKDVTLRVITKYGNEKGHLEGQFDVIKEGIYKSLMKFEQKDIKLLKDSQIEKIKKLMDEEIPELRRIISQNLQSL
jgi:GTP-binding protein EngB required for normal cell division